MQGQSVVCVLVIPTRFKFRPTDQTDDLPLSNLEPRMDRRAIAVTDYASQLSVFSSRILANSLLSRVTSVPPS